MIIKPVLFLLQTVMIIDMFHLLKEVTNQGEYNKMGNNKKCKWIRLTVIYAPSKTKCFIFL